MNRRSARFRRHRHAAATTVVVQIFERHLLVETCVVHDSIRRTILETSDYESRQLRVRAREIFGAARPSHQNRRVAQAMHNH